MIKITKFVVVIAAMLFITGCGNNPAEETPTTDTKQTESELDTQPKESSELEQDTIQSRLEGLQPDEYDQLEITAAVLEKKSILSGDTFKVTTNIKNNGDKTISYVKGSGSYVTPQALLVDAIGLQPILPIDYLGMATMDMRIEELAPGEELSFDMYIRAIEPHENFNQYTYDLYSEEQKYIGDLNWEELQERFPDLAGAAPQSYKINVYFLYIVADESNENQLYEPTGYAKAELMVSVTE